jgi:aconitase A
MPARVYVYEAASAYQAEGVPLVVLGGKEYGTGSSRDWAAKGTTLLGVRAVWPNPTSAFTATIWWAWGFCR